MLKLVNRLNAFKKLMLIHISFNRSSSFVVIIVSTIVIHVVILFSLLLLHLYWCWGLRYRNEWLKDRLTDWLLGPTISNLGTPRLNIDDTWVGHVNSCWWSRGENRRHWLIRVSWHLSSLVTLVLLNVDSLGHFYTFVMQHIFFSTELLQLYIQKWSILFQSAIFCFQCSVLFFEWF